MEPNLKIFPHLGAFPGEVGSGNSPGGIGGSWPMNLPLNYWWNFGTRKTRKTSRTRKTRKVSKASRTRKTRKVSKAIRTRSIKAMTHDPSGNESIWIKNFNPIKMTGIIDNIPMSQRYKLNQRVKIKKDVVGFMVQ
jgi:hypothetical protein